MDTSRRSGTSATNAAPPNDEFLDFAEQVAIMLDEGDWVTDNIVYVYRTNFDTVIAKLQELGKWPRP